MEKLPALAQWYLATVIASILALFGLQYIVQIEVQAEVRQLVRENLAEFDLRASGIRYRMSRGRIDIDGLRFDRDDVKLDIDSIGLHVSLATLGSGVPLVSAIEIQNLEVDIYSDPVEIWERLDRVFNANQEFPGILYQLIHRANHLRITSGRLGVHVSGEADLELSSLNLNIRRDYNNALKALIRFTLADGDFESTSKWKLEAGNVLQGHGSAKWVDLPLQRLQTYAKLPSADLEWRGRIAGGINFQGQFGKNAGWKGSAKAHLAGFGLNDSQASGNIFQAGRISLDISEFDSWKQKLDISQVAFDEASWEMRILEDHSIPFLVMLDRLRTEMKAPHVLVRRFNLTNAEVHYFDASRESPVSFPIQLTTANMVRGRGGAYSVKAEAVLDESRIDITGKGSLFPFETRLEARSEDLPILSLASFSPRLQGRLLQGGSFSGETRLFLRANDSGHLTRWRLNMNGDFARIAYATPNFPDWNMDTITVRDARIDLLENRWSIAKADISGGRMHFRPESVEEVKFVDVQQKFSIADLRIKDLMLKLELDANGNGILLPGLDGQGHIGSKGFKVAFQARQELERWKLDAEGGVPDGNIKIGVHANHVPLLQLRYMIPRLAWLDAGSAPELGGEVHLNLKMIIRPGQMRYSGKFSVKNLHFGQAGKLLQAERADLLIKQAGVGLGPQYISKFRLKNWLYHGAISQVAISSVPAKEETRAKGDSSIWQVDMLSLENGRISLGSPEDIWLSHIAGSVSGLKPGKEAKILISANAGGGTIDLKGSLDFMRAIPEFYLQAKWHNVVPFFANDWLHLSGFPRLLHGRLSGDLALTSKARDEAYSGKLHLHLLHGKLESGAYPDDPILALTGYGSQSLFNKLLGRGKSMELEIPVRGNWLSRPLDWSVLGYAFSEELKRRAEKQGAEVRIRKITPSSPRKISGLRLREEGRFSHNERGRLAKIIRFLRRNKNLIVELEPQLGRSLDADLFKRVRQTQSRIERYLHHRGIDLTRIYPVWPEAQQHGAETSSIRLLVRKP
ncbi:MAG: DUF748 domain-containing protein [Mariprofundaceae bacterium]